MICHVNTCRTARSQREITGLPRLRRSATAVPWASTRSVRIKIFISERTGCVEDAVAWYGDTVVPRLADASGFCAALLYADCSGRLLYADWASGRLISETVWQDPQVLAASRSTATAGEAAAAAALNGVIGASGEYRLAFSSVRPA